MRVALIDHQISNRQCLEMPDSDRPLTHGEQSLAVLQNEYELHAGTSLNADHLTWVSITQQRDIFYHLLRAVDKLISKQVKVICLPMGFAKPSPLLKSIVDVCVRQDILLIAPAGNNGPDKITYPAAFHNVLCVGASDPLGVAETYSGSQTDESGRCIKPEVLAEGSTINDFEHINKGTSIACAKVAGLAVALLEANPALSSAQLKNLICQSTQPTTGSRYGLVDGPKAMEAAHRRHLVAIKYDEMDEVSVERCCVDWSLENQCKRAARMGRNLKGLVSLENAAVATALKNLKDAPSVKDCKRFDHFNVVYTDAPAAFFEKLFEHPDLLWASAVDVNYFDLISA